MSKPYNYLSKLQCITVFYKWMLKSMSLTRFVSNSRDQKRQLNINNLLTIPDHGSDFDGGSEGGEHGWVDGGRPKPDGQCLETWAWSHLTFRQLGRWNLTQTDYILRGCPLKTSQIFFHSWFPLSSGSKPLCLEFLLVCCQIFRTLTFSFWYM